MSVAPPEKEKTQAQHHIPITGRFDQYRSSFWAAALAIFGARYPFREILRGSWGTSKNAYVRQHLYSNIVGGIMESVTGFFAYRTYKDMRSVFSQVLAWEFDKKPEEVGISDFRKSQNTIVQQTFSNYTKFTLERIGISLFFFVPTVAALLLKKLPLIKEASRFHPSKWSPQLGEGLGLGALALRLLSDVLGRRSTSFESLQTMIDLKINHAGSVADNITGSDLLDIYERHALDGKIKSFKPQRGTAEWDRSMAMFDRMAELMNQTYKNIPLKEHADFGIDDFIYMMGNNLIQPENTSQTLTFIEVANRYDIPALKEMVKAVKGGHNLDELLKKYPVLPESAPAEKKFTDTIPSRSSERNMPVPGSLAEQLLAKRQKADANPQLNQSA